MFRLLKLFLSLCLVSLAYGRSEAEIRNYFLSLGLQCNNESSISAEDMNLLHQHKIPDNENAKCLLACVYRKAKWMDSKGMFDVKTVNDLMEKEHIDDKTRHENTKKLTELCKKVNDEAVTDGEKGCQRAASLTTCLTDNAPKLGLAVIM